jgi:hypothetical protein
VRPGPEGLRPCSSISAFSLNFLPYTGWLASVRAKLAPSLSVESSAILEAIHHARNVFDVLHSSHVDPYHVAEGRASCLVPCFESPSASSPSLTGCVAEGCRPALCDALTAQVSARAWHSADLRKSRRRRGFRAAEPSIVARLRLFAKSLPRCEKDPARCHRHVTPTDAPERSGLRGCARPAASLANGSGSHPACPMTTAARPWGYHSLPLSRILTAILRENSKWIARTCKTPGLAIKYVRSRISKYFRGG